MDFSLILALIITSVVVFVLPTILKPIFDSNSNKNQPPKAVSSTNIKEIKMNESKKKEATNECHEGSCACGIKSKGECEKEEISPDIETKIDQTKKKFDSIKILFGSQSGTAEEWAKKLGSDAQSRGFKVEVSDLSEYDPDDLTDESILIFVISTYTDGTPPEKCQGFYHYLEDQSLDFREEKGKYKNLYYAVFGIGSSVYGKNFNTIAKNVDRIFLRLSAQRLVPVGLGDNGAGVEVIQAYTRWVPKLWKSLDRLRIQSVLKGNDNNSQPVAYSIKTKRPVKVVPKVSNEIEEDSGDEPEGGEPLADVEDLGTLMKKTPAKPKSKKPTKGKQEVMEEEEEEEEEDEGEIEEDEEDEESLTNTGEPREMLTDSLRKSLVKQGYRLLGSHSGVKMCRWTKAMMRGRGGCYKHTFYGISSFQCMEMTPSLACANKCVFCWRHHKNPVGKEWRWKMDEPEELVDLAVKNHYSMVKQLKGVPGLVPERFEQAMTIQHCALSLVGEPIIYPHINRFIELLHNKNISSFLVTNAQFPDKIETLKPVTQLYISVDAATKESLKKIDRPLFSDFWERFISCIEALSKKGQRTVFRLTLVKEWNMEELMNYAELIERGRPSFVEIKGVTYCGTSKASSLTMKNVPFHEEVRNFSRAICEATPFLRDNYLLACEHEHSCCILIADKRFQKDGVWNTWIDYPKFHDLVKSGEPFTAFDYMAPTPYWAVSGAQEGGFDPEETRFRRKKPYQKGGC